MSNKGLFRGITSPTQQQSTTVIYVYPNNASVQSQRQLNPQDAGAIVMDTGFGSGLAGVTGGWPGRRVVIVFPSTSWALQHENTNAESRDRIWCPGQTLMTFNTNVAIELIYVHVLSVGEPRWVVIAPMSMASNSGGMSAFGPSNSAGAPGSPAWNSHQHQGQVLRSIQVLTAGTTSYTSPAGINAIEVECIGPGAGGAGVPGGASSVAAGAGGGAGGYSRKRYNLSTPVTVNTTVGTGGVGGSAGANAGQLSANDTVFDSGASLGTAVTAPKGAGGGATMTAATTAGTISAGGAGAAAGTGGDVNWGGSPGSPGIRSSGTVGTSGAGAPGPYGGGGNSAASSAVGGNGSVPGSGGGGAMSTSTTTRAGGNGGDGMIIVREYA